MLDTISSDPGLQQTELVFLGLFGRACRLLEGGRAEAELTEAAQVRAGAGRAPRVVWLHGQCLRASKQAGSLRHGRYSGMCFVGPAHWAGKRGQEVQSFPAGWQQHQAPCGAAVQCSPAQLCAIARPLRYHCCSRPLPAGFACPQEADTLVQLLEARNASLCNTLEGGYPELRASVWQSEASVQAAVQVG